MMPKEKKNSTYTHCFNYVYLRPRKITSNYVSMPASRYISVGESGIYKVQPMQFVKSSNFSLIFKRIYKGLKGRA